MFPGLDKRIPRHTVMLPRHYEFFLDNVNVSRDKVNISMDMVKVSIDMVQISLDAIKSALGTLSIPKLILRGSINRVRYPHDIVTSLWAWQISPDT
jgi:hypothetical protein